MSDKQSNFDDILKHVDEIRAELKQMTDRLSRLQVDLVKKRSMLADWWAAQKAEEPQHFGQLAYS